MVFALGVITDSMRVGIGWADDGPRAGYFPFYIGLLLLGASGTIFIQTLLTLAHVRRGVRRALQLAHGDRGADPDDRLRRRRSRSLGIYLAVGAADRLLHAPLRQVRLAAAR